MTILRKQRQDLQGLEASIQCTQDDEAPWIFRAIRVVYTARGDVDETKARKALDLSEQKYCAISATLRPAVRLEFAINVQRS